MQHMSVQKFWVLALFCQILNVQLSKQMQVGRFPLLMPNVRPYRGELYLCTPVKVSEVLILMSLIKIRATYPNSDINSQ